MALNVPLLRDSFNLVVGLAPDVTTRFYKTLFAKYPASKPLFRPERQKQQEEMLAAALAAVLEKLEDGPWLEKTLGDMGARHVDYNVTPEMYGWVADSLLITLGEVAGSAWTPELKQAWTDALNAVAGLMLAGADKAEAAKKQGPGAHA